MAAASLSRVLTAPAEGAGFVQSGSRASEVQSIQLRLTPHSAPTVLFEDLEVGVTARFSCDDRIKRCLPLTVCTADEEKARVSLLEMRKQVELFRAV